MQKPVEPTLQEINEQIRAKVGYDFEYLFTDNEENE